MPGGAGGEPPEAHEARGTWLANAHADHDDEPRRVSAGTAAAWRPLRGDELLERLRVTGRRRPSADPERAFRLRSELELGLRADGVGSFDQPQLPGVGGDGRDARRPGSPLVVTKDRLTRALACDAHRAAATSGDGAPTVAMACGAVMDALFRQLVTVGSIGDAMVDGLAALSLDDHHASLVAWIERMPSAERAELRSEVDRQVEGLSRRWPVLDPSWHPRTQVSMRVPLAGGAVELSARADLVVGRPAADEASVAIVEVKSGARRIQHRLDLHFYALIETLRSPAPPFVVATYYTRTGELDVEPITDELLTASAHRVLAGACAIRDLSRGTAERSPIGPCGLCPAVPSRPGDRWVPRSGAERHLEAIRP